MYLNFELEKKIRDIIVNGVEEGHDSDDIVDDVIEAVQDYVDKIKENKDE